MGLDQGGLGGFAGGTGFADRGFAVSQPQPQPQPQSLRPSGGSLARQLLAAMLLMSLVPLGLSATLAYLRSGEMVEGYLTEGLGRSADAYAADLDLFIERQRVLLRSVPLEGQEKGSLLRQAASGDPSVHDLMLVSGEGSLIASGTGTPEPWAVSACRALAAEPGPVMTHAGAGHAHEVVLAVPRGDDVLCGQVSFSLHQDMLTRRASSTLGGSAYIIDDAGTVVCHAFEEDEPHVSRGDVLEGGPARVAGAGVAWTGTVLQPTGMPAPEAARGDGPWLAAYSPSNALPWGVWVEVPRAQAAGPLQSWLVRTLLQAGLIGAVAVLVGLALSRRLSRPLAEVVEGVRGMAAGEYGRSVPVQGPEEVATLGREFNRMSEALAQSVAELDARVQLRTAELAEARAFSDLLLDTMRERIVVISAERRIVRANQAATAAYGQGIVGRDCAAVHGEEGHDADRCPVQRVLATEEMESEEVVRIVGLRTEVLVVDRYPLPLGGGGRDGAIVEIVRDVTALRTMQSQLIHQEKMASLGTLAAGLAHEIGNPLASMSSELELMEQHWEPSEARASVPVLRDQVRRMSGLLRELIELGRAPSDTTGLVDPNEVLDGVLRLLAHDPRARGVRLERGAEWVGDGVYSNRDRVVQVLVNLGLNALDAVNGSGRVGLAAVASSEGGVVFAVEDSGPGVAADIAGRVFDPFFTTKAPGRGTGLGLFVSTRIVEALGGRLRLSDTTASGARFEVILPRRPPQSEPEDAHA